MIEEQQKLNVEGDLGAPIVVVCEPTTEGAYRDGRTMRRAAIDTFKTEAVANGFSGSDFVFISGAPPLTEEAKASDGKTNKYIDQFRDQFIEIFNQCEGARLVIYLGKGAGKALLGRPVKITEHRGQIHAGVQETGGIPFLPLFSPNYVLQRPENRPIYQSDFMLAATFRDGGYNWDTFQASMQTGDYRWVTDIGFLLDEPPKVISLDTETRGVDWFDGQKILCVQISYAKHKAITLPLDIRYWNDPSVRDSSSEHLPLLNGRLRDRLIRQLKELLGNPKVAVVGHNLKFDIHALRNYGIEISNWLADTMQLAFVIDDNMQSKTLDDCARRWSPEMAGYADAFNTKTDKSQMHKVSHRDMMEYGCGDADVSRRLAFTMDKIAREDVANYRCYEKIQIPALRMFARMEREGLAVDQDALRDLGEVAAEQEKELYDDLLSRIDRDIKTAHLSDPKMAGKPPEKVLSFSRAEFVIDWLFRHPRGLNLTPREYTKTTRYLDPADRIPSTSSKDHLPYFDHLPEVAQLMDYQKLSKLRTTYIGNPETVVHEAVPLLKSGKAYGKSAQELMDAAGVTPCYRPSRTLTPVYPEGGWTTALTSKKPGVSLIIDANGVPWWRRVEDPTGFWKYISPGGYIHPSFFLHRTVTGRSASANPNGQNIPKRGKTPRMKKLVKAYRNVFTAPPGHLLIECDLSQAELRIIAWMAKDKKMLEIYRMGGDIHTATAIAVLGITQEQWENYTKDEQDLFRFRAKAVNFGFCFSMGAAKYVGYAKTEYNIDVTERQAETIRNTYFNLYANLRGWHTGQRNLAARDRQVRALHGALRRLPSVDSSEESIKGEAMRQAINSPVQRFASDLGLIAMTRFGNCCPWDKFRPVAFIHDAVIVATKVAHAEEAMSAIKWFMQTPPLKKWFGLKTPIPILADVSIGATLGDMMERPDIEAKQPVWWDGN